MELMRPLRALLAQGRMAVVGCPRDDAIRVLDQ